MRYDPRPVTHRRGLRAILVCAPLVTVVLGVMTEAFDVFPRLRIAIQRPADDLPSTRLAPLDDVRAGLPLMSLYVPEPHLSDPVTGLFQNLLARGRDWERPGTLSYFEDGRLKFATEVGVRIHGGISREISPVKSFKIYFRGKQGADQFVPGVLFGGRADPLRRFILHNDLRADADGRFWHFQNPLAYDIVKRIGAVAPKTQPVRFFLNGQWQGVYVATEKVDVNIESPYLIGNYGHDDFATTNRDFEELALWLFEHRPWTLDVVDEVVDMDNLTRWFLSILFCATEDPFQGAQLRNNRDPDGRWFFVSWDMDHSFMDFNLQVDRPWEHDTFRTVFARAGERQRTRRPSDVRSSLLTTLFTEDESYRQYFRALFVETMNHRLTSEFLEQRLRFYRTVSETYGVTDTAYLDILGEYLEKRPAFLWSLAEQYLNTDPTTSLRLEGPTGVTLRVDGRDVGSRFDGRYFPDMTVTVEVEAHDRQSVSHWFVNGQRVELSGPPIELSTARDLTVRLVPVS